MATAPERIGAREGGALDRGLEAVALAGAPPGSDEPVFQDVNLRVEPGEWLVLTGPNGGGKTTLAMTLAGLWPPRAGRVALAGRPLAPGDHAARRPVATLLQDPSVQLLAPTVREELSLGPRHLGVPEEEVGRRVEAWARRLGFEADLERDPRELSAGRQQALLFGAAMTQAPRLLVADEATAHLDQASRRRILDLLGEEMGRGLAVVWVTQDITECPAGVRVLEVGGHGGRLPEPPPAPPAAGAGPALWGVEITPSMGRGPRVQASVPVRVAFHRTGLTLIEGPNGAGKTVLLEAMAGIRRPRGVSIHGALAAGDSGGPVLASQFPDHQIFRETVVEELVYGPLARGVPRGDAERLALEYLEAVGLDAGRFAGRRSWGLSAGEKRLVCVLSALVTPAPMVLLDEPTAGLDPRRAEVVARLAAQRSRTSCVIVATQDPQWASWQGVRRVRLGQTTGPAGPSRSKKTD